jgi:hypothetical protein
MGRHQSSGRTAPCIVCGRIFPLSKLHKTGSLRPHLYELIAEEVKECAPD